MRKKLNKKGFTLIELLAVIVILGVIMLIAVPSISAIITNSRKDSFIRTAEQYVAAARNMATAGTVNYLTDPTKATIVSVRAIPLEGKDGAEAVSPFGQPWDTSDTETSAYVVITNTSTAADPKYTFYFAARDVQGNCMGITEEGTWTRESVTTGCDIDSIEPDENGVNLTKGDPSTRRYLDSANIILK